MRVIICGGRYYDRPAEAFAYLDKFHALLPITLVIEGGQRGADRIAYDWAVKRRIETMTVPALWSTHGGSAGPLRNQAMLERHRPNLVIAFPGGSGTMNMVRLATAAGLPVYHIGAFPMEVKGKKNVKQ
jgi:hypothetical protein